MQISETISLIAVFLFASLYTSNSDALTLFKGSREALAIVERYLPSNPVIIEAGAYNGFDSVCIAKKWDQSTVYSFEPIPYLYDLLQEAAKNQANVHAYNFAVGDFVGQATMYISEEKAKPGIPSQSSSLLEPKEHLSHATHVLFKEVITVPVTTFDVWAEQNNVDHVDFMWLDMQGYELNALMAAPKIVSTVRVILTEVEFIEAYANQYQFEEVKKWLEGQGFEMIAQGNLSSGWYGDALFVRKELL